MTELTLDATELLQEAAPFNEPPPAGKQYVVLSLAGTFRGDTAGQPVFNWQLVLPDAIVLPAGDECGVVPQNLIDVREVYAGDSFEANVCFVAPADLGNAPPLLLLELFGSAGTGRYFAVK